ncbi:MAG: hypothetical protein ACKOPP_02250 [Bacteroidota bacterium]
MSWILGNTDRLMDARFAAAAGAERLLLQVPGDMQIWNEISGWVAGPELWLIANLATVEHGPSGLGSYADCTGCFVRDGEVWDKISANLEWTNLTGTAWALGLNPGVLHTIRQSGQEGRHPPGWAVLDSRVLDSRILDPDDTDSIKKTLAGSPTAWYLGMALDQYPYRLDDSIWERWLDQGEELMGLPCSGLCFEGQPGHESDYVTLQDYLDTVGGRWF